MLIKKHGSLVPVLRKLIDKSPILNDDDMLVRVSYSMLAILRQIHKAEPRIDATYPCQFCYQFYTKFKIYLTSFLGYSEDKC